MEEMVAEILEWTRAESRWRSSDEGRLRAVATELFEKMREANPFLWAMPSFGIDDALVPSGSEAPPLQSPPPTSSEQKKKGG